MIYQHKNLAQGQWQRLSLAEQMANIGSEVQRALNWKQKQNSEYCLKSFERALELLDLTMADKRYARRYREIARVRELVVDYFVGDNVYQSTELNWRKYFDPFNYLARKHL